DALDGCERILADEFKDLPESALYMIGAVDEATAKAKVHGAKKPQPDPEQQPEKEKAHALDDA
ncbi:MAG: F0F1 ATP synthase subunit beta, partial [Hydrogenophaga sp.]|nr:F0F1 ATP synthase subunit beta [Hydrogenophaga sp.]